MIHKWWHRIVRRRTRPIPEDTATKWKSRFSLMYGFFAWNAFGLILYNIMKGKGDWAHYYGIKSDEEKEMPPGLAWANTLGIKDAKVYRIKGFTPVSEYEIKDGKIVNKDSQTEVKPENKEELLG